MDENQLREAAKRYLGAGLCVLPARRGEKRPAVGSWKQYQDRPPTAVELDAWLANKHDAICLLSGRASGNLELLDFDQGGELFDPWWKKLKAVGPDLPERLVIETSQSGGWHVIYRCEIAVGGSMKLAQRLEEKPVTLIETRGEGGLFLCAPTPGYELLQGDLTELPILTARERETLLEAAWELNEYWPEPRPSAPTSAHVGPVAQDRIQSRPGDDFNARGDVADLLRKHGWRSRGERADGNEHWTRPGKAVGTSATIKDRTFYVFSSNAGPFEANQSYSPFAIYALLEHGGDYEAAARELGSQGFGEEEHYGGVDISGIMASVVRDPDTESVTTPPDPGPVPEELLRVPGFISEVMDHCLETAPYPNQAMAFCGALALQAFLAGRKVRDSGDNRTNIYLLGLAHSSAGKDWPRKINARITHAVALAECLGDRFASGEGVQDALYTKPCMLFQTDEIDGMLQSINKAKDARHESIMNTLLSLYSSSNSVFSMRPKAGNASPGVIDQPNLIIFGTAIPNHYYEALSERMLTNGFFARTLIIESGKRSEGQEPRIREIPERVVATAKWWASYLPGTGNLDNWHPEPVIVEPTDGARQRLIELRKAADEEYAKAEEESDPVGTTVWGRVSEQTRKLALLYAISEDNQSPRITDRAVKWASKLMMCQTRRMLFMASGHVARNDFDGMCKEMLRVLRDWKAKRGDEPMPEWELNRRLPWKPRDHEDVRITLMNQKRIQYDVVPTKTQPRKLYQLLEG